MSNAAYAITASFGSLSSDPNARDCMPIEICLSKGMANLKYIARQTAVNPEQHGALIYRTGGFTRSVSMDKEERRAFFSLCKSELEQRAQKHTEKTGVRLLDKAVISLPFDASHQQQLEIANHIIGQFAGDSDALVVAAIHIDKRRNPHLHLWMVDGLESSDHAKGRTQKRKSGKCKSASSSKKKTRVRRRDYIRLGEIGSRKKARLDVTAIINMIANRDGLRRAEARSLKEQGLSEKPQIHEGAQAASKAANDNSTDTNPLESLTEESRRRIETNIQTIMENHWLNFPKGEPVSLEIFPDRLKPFAIWEIARINEQFKKAQDFEAAAQMKDNICEGADNLTSEEAPQLVLAEIDDDDDWDYEIIDGQWVPFGTRSNEHPVTSSDNKDLDHQSSSSDADDSLDAPSGNNTDHLHNTIHDIEIDQSKGREEQQILDYREFISRELKQAEKLLSLTPEQRTSRLLGIDPDEDFDACLELEPNEPELEVPAKPLAQQAPEAEPAPARPVSNTPSPSTPGKAKPAPSPDRGNRPFAGTQPEERKPTSPSERPNASPHRSPPRRSLEEGIAMVLHRRQLHESPDPMDQALACHERAVDVHQRILVFREKAHTRSCTPEAKSRTHNYFAKCHHQLSNLLEKLPDLKRHLTVRYTSPTKRFYTIGFVRKWSEIKHLVADRIWPQRKQQRQQLQQKVIHKKRGDDQR